MTTSEITKCDKWVELVVGNLPRFLNQMADQSVEGRYKYSLSGDCLSDYPWGLGNTVFAAKIRYMLKLLDDAESKKMAKFIKSFQKNSGEISDPLVQNRSFHYRLYICLRLFDWSNLTGQVNRWGETRQSFAALYALKDHPMTPYRRIPTSKTAVQQYVHSLNWKYPWAAGANFSHLIFFLCNNDKSARDSGPVDRTLVDIAFSELKNYRQMNGAWFDCARHVNTFEQVSGAMKVLSAFMAAARDDYGHEKELVDLCLDLATNPDACNSFNLVLVLYCCSQKTDYREPDIAQFCVDRLKKYREHYWPENGGFSFYHNRANSRYLGAKISQSLPEPDIHGTHLFLWGITLISRMLGLSAKSKIQPPIT